MLHRLIEKAPAGTEPGFKLKTVRWALLFGQGGQFLNPIDLAGGDKKSRGLDFPRCPDLIQSEMVSAHTRHFLVDSTETVVRLTGKTSKAAKVLHDHNSFVSLLEEASSVLPELGNIAQALRDDAVRAAMLLALTARKAKPTDSVTFAVADRQPTYLVEDPSWHDWWRRKRLAMIGQAPRQRGAALPSKRGRKRKSEASLRMMRCFGSGELALPKLTHGPIEGLRDVGGRGQDLLISFDKDSLTSYGLSKSENAAVSEPMAASYRAALNGLIRQKRQQVAGAKVVHWFTADPTFDPLTLAEEGFSSDDIEAERKGLGPQAERQARELLGAIHSGKRPDLLACRYCVLTLSANSGRVVVRGWEEGSFEGLLASVLRWFMDLSIVNLVGHERTTAPGIRRVVEALLPLRKPGEKYDNWIKPAIAFGPHLWAAALHQDRPIPWSAVARAVLEQRDFTLNGSWEAAESNKTNAKERATLLSLIYTRMAFFKAYHVRRGGPDMTSALNEDHPSAAYQCGRVMAVLADLQKDALGPVGANVVERYYAAASSTPALVFGRLVRTSQFHLGKSRFANLYDQRLTGVWNKVKDALPRTLDLEQQSLFALGFYHQKAALAKDKAERAAARKAGSVAVVEPSSQEEEMNNE